jgi:hypothetical protein
MLDIEKNQKRFVTAGFFDFLVCPIHFPKILLDRFEAVRASSATRNTKETCGSKLLKILKLGRMFEKYFNKFRIIGTYSCILVLYDLEMPKYFKNIALKFSQRIALVFMNKFRTPTSSLFVVKFEEKCFFTEGCWFMNFRPTPSIFDFSFS